jgi:hypothetical protein
VKPKRPLLQADDLEAIEAISITSSTSKVIDQEARNRDSLESLSSRRQVWLFISSVICRDACQNKDGNFSMAVEIKVQKRKASLKVYGLSASFRTDGLLVNALLAIVLRS